MKYSIIREDRESVFGKKTTIKKLKIIAKKYKIKKISKLKKKELQNKVFLHLNKMYSALKIQSFFKLLLLKKILRLQGPARIKRSLCTNDTDFYDLDKVTLLDWENFISFQDDDKHIYGFTIKSLFNLYAKNNTNIECVKNPYNLKDLPPNLYSNLQSLINLYKIMKIPIDINHDITNYIISEKSYVRDVFTKIDELGNYSDPEWLLKLNKHQLILYLKELKDIFLYRADLSNMKRFLICPFQNGDPFYDTNLFSLQLKSYNVILKKTVEVIKRFIMYSASYEDNKLGSLYVLISLTIISEDARTALPHLYYSVNINN